MSNMGVLDCSTLTLKRKSTGEIISKYSNIPVQHYYPLSVQDYCTALLNWCKGTVPSLPVLSVDSHDFGYCDFHCKDCLAENTRIWAKKELKFEMFEPTHYKKVLTEIARYSAARGIKRVRLEMSGEGNPDMYPYREEIVRYAAEKCNMDVVYITSGSRLTQSLISTLAKYAAYVRFSLPGITEFAYLKYSGQSSKEAHAFTLSKAIENIASLNDFRIKYKRTNDLLIGARTCLRPENGEHYKEIVERLVAAGVDAFQIVKILVPMGDNLERYIVPDSLKFELRDLNDTYQELGLKYCQIPSRIDYYYYDRELDSNNAFEKCFSSLLCPILYGPNLIVCTHGEKIKDVENAHYGCMSGEPMELEEMLNGSRAKKIGKRIPASCQSCCSLYDNMLFNEIYSTLRLIDDVEDVVFEVI